MGARASRAVGDRAVSVGGDVVGSLIVTGDNNNVSLVVGEREGALLEQLARANQPAKRLRPSPLRSVPPPFADTVDRDGETRAILDALAARSPVNVHGPRGIGKTHAILRALNIDDPVLHEGAVYLYAPGPLDDVLQLLFEAWYECEPPFKPSTAQLRRDLAGIEGLVALDSVELERDAAQQVLLEAARCRVVITSRARVLMEGASIALHGLSAQDAVRVLEQELGRPLAGDEGADAERVCSALDGHPLKIREAVASAREAGRTLTDLAEELSVRDPAAALARDKLVACGEDGRKLLAALALLGDATVGREHLRAIAGVENFDGQLMAALRRRDVRGHSPRYNLGATLGPATDGLDLDAVGGRALGHFTSWAYEYRAQPAVVMTEAAALVALLRWAVDSGRMREAIELGRAVDHAFALERRFGAWGLVLELVRHAAVASGDRDAEAWALHQLGTRAVCLGELAAGAALLERAIEQRRELGDDAGAAYSSHNLAMVRRPRRFTRWILGHSMLMAGLLVALLAAGVVAAATLPGGSHPSAGSTSGTAPSTSTSPPRSTTSTTPSSTTSPSTTTTPSSTTSTTTTTSTTPATNDVAIAFTGSGQGQVGVKPGTDQPCSEACTVTVKTGSTVTVTATAGEGSAFVGFTGCASPDSGSSCSFTVAHDQTVTAEFEPLVSLTVSAHGGTVTSSPGGIDCTNQRCTAPFPLHSKVLLTASAPAFWQSVPGCAQATSTQSTGATQSTGSTQSTTASQSTGASPTCTVTLDGDQSVLVEVVPG